MSKVIADWFDARSSLSLSSVTNYHVVDGKPHCDPPCPEQLNSMSKFIFHCVVRTCAIQYFKGEIITYKCHRVSKRSLSPIFFINTSPRQMNVKWIEEIHLLNKLYFIWATSSLNRQSVPISKSLFEIWEFQYRFFIRISSIFVPCWTRCDCSQSLLQQPK